MRWSSLKPSFLLLTVLLAGLASADEGADVRLKRLGTISGRVVAETGGAPLAGVKVEVVNLAASTVEIAETDDEGAFRSGGLRAGTYFVVARTESEYLDEIYEDVPCGWPRPDGAFDTGSDVLGLPPCNPKEGTPVIVRDDAETFVELGLLRGASVSGRVTEEATGEAVAHVLVVAEAVGYPGFAFYAVSDEDGFYEIRGIAPGTYLFGTFETDDHPRHITEITFMAETDVSPYDFALAPGARIRGTVVDAATGEPVDRAVFRFSDADGLHSVASSDSTGKYSSVPLAAGSYDVKVFTQFHVPETRTDVLVAAGEEVDVDFALTRVRGGRGAISGRVIAEDTGLPIRAVSVSAYPYPLGTSVTKIPATTDNEGRYRIEDLADGTYYVQALAFSFYEDEVYDDVPCRSCDLSLGTAVEVREGRETSGIDFALARNGRLVGRLFDEETGEMIREGEVTVYSREGFFLGRDDVDDGSFSFDSLDSGRYYVLARGLDFVDEAYPDLPCFFGVCDLADADLVEVKTGVVTEIAFSLSRGSRLTGRVIASETGNRLPGVDVTVHDRMGAALGTVRTDDRGVYEFTGLPGGRYYISTPGSHGYRGELYGGVPCPFTQCDVTEGQAVGVRPGTTRRRLDLELDFGAGSLTGIVRQEPTGQRVTDLLVRVYDERGRRVASVRTDGSGYYHFASVPAGTYYLRTPDTSTYHGELYDDVPCPRGCRITRGTKVKVAGGDALTGLDFDLSVKP